MLGEGVDLGLTSPVHEVDEPVTGHLVGEPGAPVTENAAFAVQVDVVIHGDGLLEVALLLDEAALSGAEGHGLVLQRALAALVADRTVQRVVDKEELKHAVLGLAGPFRLGVDDHPRGARQHARRLEGRPPAGVDLDQAHTAHAHWLHTRVVAEAGDVGAGALAGVDQQLAWASCHRLAVNGDLHVLSLGTHEPASPGATAETGIESPRMILASNS